MGIILNGLIAPMIIYPSINFFLITKWDSPFDTLLEHLGISALVSVRPGHVYICVHLKLLFSLVNLDPTFYNAHFINLHVGLIMIAKNIYPMVYFFFLKTSKAKISQWVSFLIV